MILQKHTNFPYIRNKGGDDLSEGDSFITGPISEWTQSNLLVLSLRPVLCCCPTRTAVWKHKFRCTPWVRPMISESNNRVKLLAIVPFYYTLTLS